MNILKIIIVVSLLDHVQTMSGQEVLDTIQANDQMNVALFFSSPIKRAITGNNDVIFSYNRDEAEYFGLLQATNGHGSNLLVVTMDGQAYDFKVEYEKSISQTHFFVGKGNSIGPIHPLRDGKVDTVGSHPSHFSLLKGLLLSSDHGAVASVRRKGILLRASRLDYHGNEVFMVVEIRNRSGIDFEVGTLNALRLSGSAKRRSSYQETRLNPLCIFNRPKIIGAGASHRFVIVFPKFVLAPGEQLKLVVLERHGSRRLELKY